MQSMTSPSQLRHIALARWDNEGGAGPGGPASDHRAAENQSAAPLVRLPALAHLHARIIALENLLIALLAEASSAQVALTSEMEVHIAPRPGFTRHPLTTQAAVHMRNLIERAAYFRSA